MAIFPGTAITPAGGGAGYTIDQSLRFNDDDSAYLSRTPASSPTNGQKFTISCWFKRGNLGGTYPAIYCANDALSSGAYSGIFTTSSNEIYLQLDDANGAYNWITTPVFRDVSAWYHIVWAVDTTQATATDRMKLYVNGSLVTDYSTQTTVPQNSVFSINGTTEQNIGKFVDYSRYIDGYISEFHCIDGQALDPSYFGETDATYGHWKPIEYTGTYGTNGFYLPFSGTFYNDASGNGNNWTANNLAATDVVLDSPTNNFATINPLRTPLSASIYEGNLKATGGSGQNSVKGTFLIPKTGKWYWEITNLNSTNSGTGIGWGISTVESTANLGSGVGVWQVSNGDYFVFRDETTNLTWQGSGWSLSTGTVGQVAYDADNGKIWVGLNNTWYAADGGTDGDPSNGLNHCASGISGDIIPHFSFYSSGQIIANFGQDSSFAGNKTAQNNTDANGYGDFYYSPPSGFLALCTANLSDPAVVPGEHFNTVLYTGTGSTQSITGVGFQPDFLWIKNRGETASHGLQNAVTGADKQLRSNSTAAEEDTANNVTSFDSDGFSLGNNADGISTNESGRSYVAWNWKANNTSGSSNTDGSITSTVAANADAGFSIVGWTAINGVSTQGHGLTQTPEMIIAKSRANADSWYVWFDGFSANEYLILNSTNAKASYSSIWGVTPTATTFGVTASSFDSGAAIAYCFHSVDGYSKFGSYTGNGSTDGSFIYTGHRPMYVMIKCTSSANDWIIIDTKRMIGNVSDDNELHANASIAEQNDDRLDILSNGFKLRNTGAAVNGSGASYIFMSFAENPFKYSNGR